MNLQGATIVVTGGARGIGRGVVEAFAAEGANVVIGDLLSRPEIAEACAETEDAARALGAETLSTETDVTSPDGCRALVDAALRRFGRLDVVCANAGVISTGPVADLAPEEWDRMFSVNAKGVFLTCQAALGHFLAQQSGCFVNIASIAGKRGQPNAAAYAASKFAVVGFTQSLALEVASQGVRANAICPGFLGTSMWLNDILARQKSAGRDTSEVFERYAAQHTPLGRPQTPADIGQAAVYLARADNVTGIALTVAGGVEVL